MYSIKSTQIHDTTNQIFERIAHFDKVYIWIIYTIMREFPINAKASSEKILFSGLSGELLGLLSIFEWFLLHSNWSMQKILWNEKHRDSPEENCRIPMVLIIVCKLSFWNTEAINQRIRFFHLEFYCLFLWMPAISYTISFSLIVLVRECPKLRKSANVHQFSSGCCTVRYARTDKDMPNGQCVDWEWWQAWRLFIQLMTTTD